MSILIFFAVLFVLILVHELGHFATAKWFKMRVDEFGIGFPPKLFGIKKGETEYTFNLFPIGGFVKIYGEDSVGIEDEQGIAQTEGAFTSKSKWKQAIVLVAGVTMNVLFAWILVAIAFGIGVRTAVLEEDASKDAELTVATVLEDGPAGIAGLEVGSTLTKVEADGGTLSELTPSAFDAFVQEHTEDIIVMTLTDGKTIEVSPQQNVIDGKEDKYAVGIALAQIDIVSRGFVDSITDSFIYVVSSLKAIVVGVTTLIAQSVMMQADFSQVAGPVGIVGLVGEASAFGVTTLLIFTAFISLNLAVINILPFPALDGGRLLFVAIEALKGSPIKPQWVATLNTIGFVLLILLMVAVTWNDIAQLI